MTTHEQDRILYDLSRHLMDSIARKALDTTELCDAAQIPKYETTLAVAGTVLFMAIDLMHILLPNMSSREFGAMAEQRFAEYVARERKSR